MIEETEKDKIEFVPVEYKLIIPLRVYQKLFAYVDTCPIEISGMGDIEYNADKKAFIISEIYLFKQECTSGSTKLDDDELNKFNFKQIKDNKPLPRLWWHSHADMGVFWSGTDEEAQRKLENNDYSVSLVVNHDHDTLCRLIQWKPFPVLIDDMPVKIDFTAPRISRSIITEVAQKVKEVTYSYSKDVSNPQTLDDLDKEIPDDINSKGKVIMTLPHNVSKAIAKVHELHLLSCWDIDRQEWIWQEPQSNRIWVDESGILVTFLDSQYD